MSASTMFNQKLEIDDSLISSHSIDDELKILDSNEDSFSIGDNLILSTNSHDRRRRNNESDDGSLLSSYDESILLEKQSLLMSPNRSLLSNKVRSNEDSAMNSAECAIQHSESFDTKVGESR